jgi:septum formation protein
MRKPLAGKKKRMFENLKKYNIILASNSPRRRELLAGLGIDFEVKVLPDIEENYPESLSVKDIAEYIASEKASAYKNQMADNDLIITADTVVIVDDKVLGKPADAADAAEMLRLLSGKKHQVITGVCLTTKAEQRRFSVVTDVTFKQLTNEEICYYIETYRPFDKAGAYGIQEWIGYVGVTGIDGSYYNVMGLPIQRIYTEMQNL